MKNCKKTSWIDYNKLNENLLKIEWKLKITSKIDYNKLKLKSIIIKLKNWTKSKWKVNENRMEMTGEKSEI